MLSRSIVGVLAGDSLERGEPRQHLVEKLSPALCKVQAG